MLKEIGVFLLKLTGFSVLLLAVHYYVLLQFFSGELYFPIWAIYCFNAVLVIGVYVVLRAYAKKQFGNMFKLFLITTLVKMVLVILFLLPLFLKKSQYTQVEVFNFFIAYFLFLIFETIALKTFLQKT
ncbi:MAG: hypothetical protein AAFO99_07245 [Bacteroidota bacterium]